MMKLKVWQYVLLAMLLIAAIQVTGCSGAFTPAEPAAGPSAVTAMDGYKVAETEALAWNRDAALGFVLGSSHDIYGNQAPIDGTAHTWMYIFCSRSANKCFLVYVINGSAGKMYEHAYNSTSDAEEFSGQYGIRPMADWTVDSVAALQTALSAYKAQAHFGGDPARADYVLKNYRNTSTGEENFYWAITLYPGQSASTADGEDSMVVYVDPMDGGLLFKPAINLAQS